MQSIEANVKIIIPEEYVLVDKEQFQKLQDSSLEGKWWGLKDLMLYVDSKDPKWIRDNVLDCYQELLDVKGNGLRIAFYPGPGQKWKFNAVRMKKFLDDFFPEIWAAENIHQKKGVKK